MITGLVTFNTLYPYESTGNVPLSGFCGGGTPLAVSLAVHIKNKQPYQTQAKIKRVEKSIKKMPQKRLTRRLDFRLLLAFLGSSLPLLLCSRCLQLLLCNLKIFLRAVCFGRIWRSICIIRDIIIFWYLTSVLYIGKFTLPLKTKHVIMIGRNNHNLLTMHLFSHNKRKNSSTVFMQLLLCSIW